MSPQHDPPARKSRTLLLSVPLIDRARNAVSAVRAIPGEPTSLADLAERAIEAEVTRLETAHNAGEPFPPGELRPGPGPGVMEQIARRRRVSQSEDHSQATPADNRTKKKGE